MQRPLFIRKDPQALRVPPHFADYERDRRAFSWAIAARALDGLPGGGLNIAHEAVDRHAAGPLAGRVAMRFVGGGLPPLELNYAELARQTSRFANGLVRLGLRRGERLFILAGRIPETTVAMLGALKAGVVVSPLFAAFGPDPIATRVNLGEGRVLLTTESLYRRKLADWRTRMPGLRQVVVVPEPPAAPSAGPVRVAPGIAAEHGVVDYGELMAASADDFAVERTSVRDPALLHFTSGTTGAPKGAIHCHGAAVAHHATGLYALDLHDEDHYWCTADPGWVTGTAYGILAPLLHGVRSLVDRDEFDAARWYTLLEAERISVWYTAPTAIRMLMRAGPQALAGRRFPALRFVASVGEPLNPEAVWWGEQTLGLPIHDNWWQTETGGIMIANTPAFEIRPGSMGRPLPGVEAAVVERLTQTHRNGSQRVRVIEKPGIDGELALRVGWPSMFRGYLNDETRYRRCFADGWYLSGDIVRRDADGWYWFVGRGDDVIKAAGHLIGPFEVESALMEHPAVAEAAAIGVPDPVSGESVKAFVCLKLGTQADEALRENILAHARRRLGPAVAPRAIAFAATLPRTRSGKIMRRLLRARELGLPEGDISALETAA